MESVKIYALGGIRESTPEQYDAVNDTIQKDKIKFLAQQLSVEKNCEVEIVDYLELAESATGGKQPFQKAIDRIKDYNQKNLLKKISYFLFMDFRRQGRSGVIFYNDLKRQLAGLGVSLRDATGVISDLKVNTLADKGLEYPWSVYHTTEKAEFLEAEAAKDNFREIMTQLIGAEIHYTRLGYVIRESLFGFQNVKEETVHGERVVLKPHPVEHVWMALIYERLLEGIKSDAKIIEEVNARGFKTRREKRHDPNNPKVIIGHRGEKPLTQRLLDSFKVNPRYAGVNNEKWITTQGYAIKYAFPVLITIPEFNKINKGKLMLVEKENNIVEIIDLTKKPLQKRSHNLETYPFKPYIGCPHPGCGHRLTGSKPRGKSGKLHPTYSHYSKVDKHYFGIAEDKLEKTVAKFLAKVKFTKGALVHFETRLLARYEKRQIDEKQKSIDLETKVAALKTEQLEIMKRIKKSDSEIVIKMLSDEVEKLEKDKTLVMANRDETEEVEVDLALAIAQTKYYLEHLDDLIMRATNPLAKGTLFSLIFAERPTYEDLKVGTPQLKPIFELKDPKNQLVRLEGFEPPTNRLERECSIR